MRREFFFEKIIITQLTQETSFSFNLLDLTKNLEDVNDGFFIDRSRKPSTFRVLLFRGKKKRGGVRIAKGVVEGSIPDIMSLISEKKQKREPNKNSWRLRRSLKQADDMSTIKAMHGVGA